MYDFGLKEAAPHFVARKLDALIDQENDPDERRMARQEAGYTFWEAAPPVFKQVIWGCRCRAPIQKLVDEQYR